MLRLPGLESQCRSSSCMLNEDTLRGAQYRYSMVGIQWVSIATANLPQAVQSCLSCTGSTVAGFSLCSCQKYLSDPIRSFYCSLFHSVFPVHLPFVRHISLVLTEGKGNSLNSQGTHNLMAENHWECAGWFMLAVHSAVRQVCLAYHCLHDLCINLQCPVGHLGALLTLFTHTLWNSNAFHGCFIDPSTTKNCNCTCIFP